MHLLFPLDTILVGSEPQLQIIEYKRVQGFKKADVSIYHITQMMLMQVHFMVYVCHCQGLCPKGEPETSSPNMPSMPSLAYCMPNSLMFKIYVYLYIYIYIVLNYISALRGFDVCQKIWCIPDMKNRIYHILLKIKEKIKSGGLNPSRTISSSFSGFFCDWNYLCTHIHTY